MTWFPWPGFEAIREVLQAEFPTIADFSEIVTGGEK